MDKGIDSPGLLRKKDHMGQNIAANEKIISIGLLQWFFTHAKSTGIKEIVFDHTTTRFPDKTLIISEGTAHGIRATFIDGIKKADHTTDPFMVITYPEKTAKVKNNCIHEPPYNDGRPEFIRFFEIEKKMKSYAEVYSIVLITYPSVLFAADADTFRKGMLPRLKSIINIPYGRIMFTSRTLFALEFASSDMMGAQIQIGTITFTDSLSKASGTLSPKERASFSEIKWDYYFEMDFNERHTSVATISLSDIRKSNTELIDIFRGKNTGTRVYSERSLKDISNKTVAISVSNIQEGKICFPNEKIDLFEGNKRKDQEYIIQENDLIMASKGTMPKVALYPMLPLETLTENIGFDLTDEALFEKKNLTARMINTYMPIEVYKRILLQNIKMLASSSLIVVHIEADIIPFIFNKNYPQHSEFNQEKTNKQMLSYFMRYLCLILRDNAWGYNQLQSLQKGGQIINLNPEKVFDLKIPDIGYIEMVNFVDNVEEFYYAIEKNKRNIDDQIFTIEKMAKKAK